MFPQRAAKRRVKRSKPTPEQSQGYNAFCNAQYGFPVFSRLRDRTYTTPFREKKAKTQGQLNGNVKLAGSEYGRINVSIDTALILYRRNRTLQIILMSNLV